MALGSFQQDQYRLIKGVLRLPGAVRFELGDRGAKAIIQQPWIVYDDMAPPLSVWFTLNIWVLTAALTSSVIWPLMKSFIERFSQ